MAYFVAFAITFITILMLRDRALALGLIDHPGAHRNHDVPTPVIGGIAMALGIAAGISVSGSVMLGSAGMVLGALVLLAAGVWDDARQLPYAIRFGAQILAAWSMIWLGGVVLTDLGRLFEPGTVLYLGRWSIPLTVFAAVGVINAMNMSDGMDGLAGLLALATTLVLAILSAVEGHHTVVDLLVFASAITAFLLWNLRFRGRERARVFMGDAGSTLLGFVLAWFLIEHSQGGDRLIRPVTALWIFALPLCDAVATMIRRGVRGKSPFRADRGHYHHYLQLMGLNVNQTLIAVLLTALGLALVGIAGQYLNVPEHYMFYGFLLFFGAYVVLMEYFQRRIGRGTGYRRSIATEA